MAVALVSDVLDTSNFTHVSIGDMQVFRYSGIKLTSYASLCTHITLTLKPPPFTQPPINLQ
jgi:hypothetical protein